MTTLGKYVALKPYARDDVPTLTAWNNDPDFWGEFFNHTIHTAEHWEENVAAPPGPAGWERYIVMDRAMTERMGVAFVVNPFGYTSLYRGLEIAYVVAPAYRRRGIATQAACVLINHLFNTTTTERIHANVVAENEGSCRVLEHAGMQRDGLLRRVMFLHGRYVDMHHYAIVREDWRNEATYREGRREF